MPKPEVEAKLLALDENEPLRGRLQTVARTVTLDGETVEAEFRYLAAGERAAGRPVVVLVHATPGSLVSWVPVVFGQGGLEQSCEVYAVEMVGHGVTRTELDDYSFERCAGWLNAFLEALDLTNVTLVGNSYGGEFVWRAALNDPDRIARIVLMSSSGFARNDDEWLPEEVQMREMSLAKLGWMLNSRDRVRTALQPHFQEKVSDAHVEEVFLACSNRDNWHAMIDLARDENGTRSAELAGLRQPTLLLWGAKDIAYRPERFAALFASTIPLARLELVPDAGHYPQEEQPSAVARAVADFARGG
jgi:pimeloyl-ACP methyl ester carboxylesterase